MTPRLDLKPSEHQCARCGETFGSLTLFDAHQTADYSSPQPVSCATPQALGLVPDGRGTWQTPRGLIARQRAAGMLARRRART